MGLTIRLLSGIVLIAGLTDVIVLGATRSGPEMNGVIDASEITWAHAVNSWDALEKALSGPIDFLEADISSGNVKGNEGPSPIPIMAHPPDITSDISLDTWLSTVAAKRPDKGIKLDFKSLDVVEPSLVLLKKYSSKLNSVWLNADVLPGPVNSQAIPVEPKSFLSLCQLYFPNATLSIGWTTNWYSTFVQESWQYGWQHVRMMADVIRCKDYGNDYPKFTFPVRGIFISRSIKQFQWLLSVIPSSTLTVWSGIQDPLQLEDLLRIRSSFPKDRVFYDVPGNVLEVFREKKDTVAMPTYNFNADDKQWSIFTKGKGDICSSSTTYVKNDTIAFGKSQTIAVLTKNSIVLKENDNLRLTGKVIFYDTGDQFVAQANVGMHELSIILADVSLFTKDALEHSEKEVDLTTSDTEVLWSAINSSVIYTFRPTHATEGSEYSQTSEDFSCMLFKLDTSEDKSFEVWRVRCDAMLEERSFEELLSNGTPDISSRKRLVLPKAPFMLGFMSAGDKHVTIYDLKLTAHKEAFSTGSSPHLSIFTVIISLLALLILF